MTRRDLGSLNRRRDHARRASSKGIMTPLPTGTIIASTRVQPPQATREDLRREAAEAWQTWSATRASST